MKKFTTFIFALTYSLPLICADHTRHLLPLNAEGLSPFHWACREGQKDDVQQYITIFQKLGTLKEEINRPTGRNTTKNESFLDRPTHLAAWHRRWDIIVLLVAHEADFTAKNSKRKTPEENIPRKNLSKYHKALKQGEKLKLTLQQNEVPGIAVQTSSTCISTTDAQVETNLNCETIQFSTVLSCFGFPKRPPSEPTHLRHTVKTRSSHAPQNYHENSQSFTVTAEDMYNPPPPYQAHHYAPTTTEAETPQTKLKATATPWSPSQANTPLLPLPSPTKETEDTDFDLHRLLETTRRAFQHDSTPNE